MTSPSQDPLEGTQLAQARNYPAKHQCPRCPCSFKRIEHLKRHVRSHTSQKPFACDVCHKEFARSDILHRHGFTHEPSMRERGRPKRRRACTECAKARERCTKDEPCRRCSIKALSCAYPPEPRGRQRGSSTRNELGPDDILNSDTRPNVRAHDFQQSLKPRLQPSLLVPSLLPVTFPTAQTAIEMMGTDALDHQQQRSHVQIGGGSSMATDSDLPHTYLSPMYDPASQMDVDALFPLAQDQGVFSQSMDYPMNWLPANDSINIDYSSILGFGVGSYADTSPLNLGVNQDISLLARVDTNCAQDRRSGIAGVQLDSTATDNRHMNEPIGVAPTTLSISSPTNTTSSCSQRSASGSRLSTLGGLYATSNNGARIPCTVRSRKHRHFFSGATPVKIAVDLGGDGEDAEVTLGFPPLDGIVSGDVEESIDKISIPTYDTILVYFRKLCLTPGSFYPPFLDENFLSIDQMNILIQMYFEAFDPIFPIVHREQVNLNDFWPLALAICATGCRFTETEEFTRCVAPFQEFLRRVLAFEVESNPPEETLVPLTQALILSQVGLLYSGQRKPFIQARARHSCLIQLVHTIGSSKLQEEAPARSDEGIGEHTQREWKSWIIAETQRRLGYSVWLLDCMSRYHFGEMPTASTSITQCELPSEDLWNCKTAWQWSRLFRKTERNPSLLVAVTMLFLEKKVQKDIGQFSSMLLLHGIYEEIRRVQCYLDRPLSSWVPSLWLNPGSSPVEGGHRQASPPSDPKTNIAVWRNAALDCVDVLHWAANATVASAAGVEHSTILHLHLSRVVLLVPYTSIQTLAKSISTLAAGRSNNWSWTGREDALRAEQEVVRWVQQDEHKARLAVLHCGCLYWHIRRYSRRAFYEPVSVFLATLTLWAYSMYALRVPIAAGGAGAGLQIDLQENRSGSVTRNVSPEESPSDQSPGASHGEGRIDTTQTEFEDDPEPTFIRLDRPNDDEMVQQFVKSGRPSVMRAYITGVGNISSPQGPAKILREGRKILSSVSLAWSRTRDYISVLESVEAVTVNNHIQGSHG